MTSESASEREYSGHVTHLVGRKAGSYFRTAPGRPLKQGALLRVRARGSGARWLRLANSLTGQTGRSHCGRKKKTQETEREEWKARLRRHFSLELYADHLRMVEQVPVERLH